MVEGTHAVFGGAKRTRTADPLHAMQVLYQLSYNPKDAVTVGWIILQVRARIISGRLYLTSKISPFLEFRSTWCNGDGRKKLAASDNAEAATAFESLCWRSTSSVAL